MFGIRGKNTSAQACLSSHWLMHQFWHHLLIEKRGTSECEMVCMHACLDFVGFLNPPYLYGIYWLMYQFSLHAHHVSHSAFHYHIGCNLQHYMAH